MKSGFVAVIGKANAGKSTLVNVLVGEKVAIVSPKPQTTRDRILGVLNTPEAQIAFVDTPGIYRSKTALSDIMMRTAEKYKPLAADSLQLLLQRYGVERIIVGHTIFEDVSTFYGQRVIGVNVNNEDNRREGRGRGLLIDGTKYLVVGDKGVLRPCLD